MNDMTFSDRLADLVETGGLRADLPPIVDRLHAALHHENSVGAGLRPDEWPNAERWERTLRREAEAQSGALWHEACAVIDRCEAWEQHRDLINSHLRPYGLSVRRVRNSADARITIDWGHYARHVCSMECDRRWPRWPADGGWCEGCGEQHG